jgi:hypothetical protein
MGNKETILSLLALRTMECERKDIFPLQGLRKLLPQKRVKFR